MMKNNEEKAYVNEEKFVELIYDSDKNAYGYMMNNEIIEHGFPDFETVEREAIRYAVKNDVAYQFDIDFTLDVLEVALDNNDFVGLELDGRDVLPLKTYGFITRPILSLADSDDKDEIYEKLFTTISNMCSQYYTDVSALMTANTPEEAKEYKIISDKDDIFLS